MKVVYDGFKPSIIITLETIQEYSAFVEAMKIAYANTNLDEKASNIAADFALALGFDINSP